MCLAMCNVSKDDSPLTKEDPHHPALTIDINLNNFISKEFLYNDSSRKHNFRRANFLLMYEMIQVTDWSYLESFTDINDACEHFYNIINNIFNTCVPVYKQSNRTYQPWFNLEIINNIRKKDRAHKNYKKFNTNIYLEQFKTLRSLIKQQIKAAYKTYIHDLERNIHSDPSKFWSFVQRRIDPEFRALCIITTLLTTHLNLWLTASLASSRMCTFNLTPPTKFHFYLLIIHM